MRRGWDILIVVVVVVVANALHHHGVMVSVRAIIGSIRIVDRGVLLLLSRRVIITCMLLAKAIVVFRAVVVGSRANGHSARCIGP